MFQFIAITVCGVVCQTIDLPYHGDPRLCDLRAWAEMTAYIPRLGEGETITEFGCKTGESA